MSVIATSVFWTRSSSAFSTSNLAASCFAWLEFFRLSQREKPRVPSR